MPPLQFSTSTVDAPTNTCRLLKPRLTYKPFEYPQYFEYFKRQNQAHWLPTEVSLESDVTDYRFHLTPEERNLVTQVLRFFTQGDVVVNDNYNTRLIPTFPKPEVKMMLSAFASMESVHVWAYSYLNDSLGLPESEYAAFLDYKSMREKCEFLQGFDISDLKSLALNMAVFGAFMEGVSLFGSFAILMNFPRLGKLKGVGQIVTWSQRDEALHSDGVCRLFRDLVQENPLLDTDSMRAQIKGACREIVRLEDNFIETCFALGPVTGLTAQDVKWYIRFIADKRLKALGLYPIYNVSNPLPWLDIALNAKEHANFFEARATEYTKGAVISDWE